MAAGAVNSGSSKSESVGASLIVGSIGSTGSVGIGAGFLGVQSIIIL